MPPIDKGVITAASKYAKMNERTKVAFITAIAIGVLGITVYFLFLKNSSASEQLHLQCETEKAYYKRLYEVKDSMLEQRRIEYNQKLEQYNEQLTRITQKADKVLNQ